MHTRNRSCQSDTHTQSSAVSHADVSSQRASVYRSRRSLDVLQLSCFLVRICRKSNQRRSGKRGVESRRPPAANTACSLYSRQSSDCIGLFGPRNEGLSGRCHCKQRFKYLSFTSDKLRVCSNASCRKGVIVEIKLPPPLSLTPRRFDVLRPLRCESAPRVTGPKAGFYGRMLENNDVVRPQREANLFMAAANSHTRRWSGKLAIKAKGGRGSHDRE